MKKAAKRKEWLGSPCPVPGCRKTRRPHQYLCSRCFAKLPAETQRALYLNDRLSGVRYRRLLEFAEAGVKLKNIVISREPK